MQDQKSDFTSLSELGEFGLIERLTKNFKNSSGLLKGVGDDASVSTTTDGKLQLVTTDLLLEGIHFDLSYTPLKHLGYKAVAVNLSDIFAMNGKPTGITVSIAVSNRFNLEALEVLYEGITFACERYNIDLLGGDTSSSTTGLVISVTAIGEVGQENVVYRNGAKENDLLCVSGDLGAAYAGLQILEREKKVFLKNPEIQPDLAGYDYVVGRQLKPEPRADIIDILSKAGIRPTSMIDLSDGLSSDLLHICQQSKLGAEVYQEKIPIDHQTVIVAEDFNLSPMTYAANGGEDYELLFTISLKDYDKIKSIDEIKVIGHMTADQGAFLVGKNGEVSPLVAQGWNHFQNN